MSDHRQRFINRDFLEECSRNAFRNYRPDVVITEPPYLAHQKTKLWLNHVRAMSDMVIVLPGFIRSHVWWNRGVRPMHVSQWRWRLSGRCHVEPVWTWGVHLPPITTHPTRLYDIAFSILYHLRGRVRTVFDPFCGLGSFGGAASDLGMDFLGVEINPERFSVACERRFNKRKDHDESKDSGGNLQHV